MNVRNLAGIVGTGVCHALVCVLVAGVGALGAEQTSQQMADRIDALIDARLQEAGVTPAAQAEDAEFLRRIHLDLAGRIPSVSQVRDFLNDTSPDKRARLIDRILDSPAFINHLSNQWQAALLPGNSTFQPNSTGGLQDWLRNQFSNNLRYDRLVADLIATRGTQQDGPAVFFTSQQLEPKKVAATTARLFLGLQLECAECHDHPFDHWKQTDFWAFTAFFARLPAGDAMQNATTRALRDRLTGEVTLPDTDTVVAPKFPGGRTPDANEPGTRRQQLSIWLASPENPYLARAAVNRVWAQLFGRGMVHPVDDMGAHNPASHPQLLDELAEYFLNEQYDLRQLLRTLCRTRAYQRTSQVDPANVPPAKLLAQMPVKVQTAAQIYNSLARCLSQAGNNTVGGPGGQLAVSRRQFEAQMSAPASDPTGYQRGLQQALLMLNGDVTGAATNIQGSALLRALRAPFLDDERRVEVMYLATLSRLPTEAERQRVAEFLAAAEEAAAVEAVAAQQSAAAQLAPSTEVPPEDKAAAVDAAKPGQAAGQGGAAGGLSPGDVAMADVLWALLNSAEFAMVP